MIDIAIVVDVDRAVVDPERDALDAADARIDVRDAEAAVTAVFDVDAGGSTLYIQNPAEGNHAVCIAQKDASTCSGGPCHGRRDRDRYGPVADVEDIAVAAVDDPARRRVGNAAGNAIERNHGETAAGNAGAHAIQRGVDRAAVLEIEHPAVVERGYVADGRVTDIAAAVGEGISDRAVDREAPDRVVAGNVEGVVAGRADFCPAALCRGGEAVVGGAGVARCGEDGIDLHGPAVNFLGASQIDPVGFVVEAGQAGNDIDNIAVSRIVAGP